MSRLFLISVGGSGTRVIESLVHMLAMGGQSEQWPEEIHILIMEMDMGNGNFVRLHDLLEKYQAMQKACSVLGDRNRFFKPKIIPYFWLPLTANPFLRKTLHTLVGVDEKAQILSSLLYTEEEMNMTIDNGFKGRPALGIAYFNQLSPLKDAAVRGFLEAMQRSDPDSEQDSAQAKPLPRVLIISSCHGGTGATGIPALEQMLHKHFSLQPLHLGLLLMLPTFSVPKATEDSTAPIDSSSFNDKVKTVFSYYGQDNLFCEHDGRGYRWTYLLGYQQPIPFSKYSEGSEKQNNPCTIFDWYATTAIYQFYTGRNECEPDPGIYLSMIPPTIWDYRRFETVFPFIATDVTSMLHTSLIFHRHLMPDLERLRGKASNYGVETYAKRLFHLPYLHDFYPKNPAQFDEAAVAKTFEPFAEYTASFISWLYDVLCHTPTDYPEDTDTEAIIRFHRLPDALPETLKESFDKQKPEYIRSLVKQQFVNALYLHKAQVSLSKGLPFPAPEKEPPEEFSGALYSYFIKGIENLDQSYTFSVMTPQTGTPPIQTPYILGELSDYQPASTSIPEGMDAPTWALLMALLMVVQSHHPIKRVKDTAKGRKKHDD